MLKKLFVLMCVVGLLVSCANGVYRDSDHPAMTANCPEAEAVALATPVMNEVIYFDFDKTVLKPKSVEALNYVAEMMAAHDDLNVIVEGHTDRIGSDSYNQALSERRAAAVKAFLLEKGIDETRIGTVGFGETRLVSKTHWENRRAVVLSVD